jgi:hypothetical protein
VRVMAIAPWVRSEYNEFKMYIRTRWTHVSPNHLRILEGLTGNGKNLNANEAVTE